MQKRIIVNAIVILLGFTTMAQDRKVAVFDPAGSVDNTIKEIVREEISSIIVNTGGYTVLERQLIDKVLEENKFQKGGLVDDSQISEIGKRMGANLVFVTNLTSMSNGNYYVSCKLIDVQTARIEKQKTGQTQKKSDDLISVVQKMVKEMFSSSQTPATLQNKTTKVNSNMAFSEFKSQLKAEKKEHLYEKKTEPNMLLGNSLALKSYKKYRNEKIAGWALLGSGAVLAGPVGTCVALFGDTYVYGEPTGYYDEWGDWISTGTNGYWTDGGVIAGCVLWGIGGAAFITGIGLLIHSGKSLETSYHFYTNGGKTACSFNITPLISPKFQGVSFSLKF